MFLNRSSSGRKIYLLFLILATLTLIVYYPAFLCDFTNWDDPDLILKNPLIRSLSWENLKKMFGGFYWYNYQPLTLLSLAIEFHFFKLDPFIYHFDNVLLHTFNALLVFSLIRALSGKNDSAFIAAALFAIHPMHVESVAWATERKDVLYTFFFLMALIQYVKYTKIYLQPIAIPSTSTKNTTGHAKSKWGYYIAALFLFILSGMAKGMAASLSLAIVAIDYLLGRKWNRSFFLDKIPFFTISIFFGLIVSFGVASDPLNSVIETHSFFEKIQYASYGMLYYIYKLFFPVNLSAFIPYPYRTGTLPAYYLLYPAFVALISIFFLWSARWSRKALFAYAFFLGTIIMVIQIKQTNAAMVADHYTYIPYIGLFFIIGEIFHYLRNPALSFLKQSKSDAFMRRTVISGVAVVIILFFGYLSHERIKVWQNSLTLWQDATNKYPSYTGYMNLGNEWRGKKKYKNALENYNMAIKIDPFRTHGYINRGYIKNILGNPSEAIKDFNRALRLNPNSVDAYVNISVARLQLKDTLGAIAACDSAIKIDPENSHTIRGTRHSLQKNYDKAINDFSMAIAIDPYTALHYWERGDIFAAMQKYREAIKDYTTCIQLDSTISITRLNEQISRVYYNRALAEYLIHDNVNACEDWHMAYKLGYTVSIKDIYAHCSNLLSDSDIKNALSKSKQPSSPDKMRYNNGKTKIEVVDVFENNRKVKKIKHYDLNGILLEEGVVDESGKYNGAVNWFYANGKIKIAGYYKDTIPTGRWKEFYENGTLMAEYSYQDGKKEGMYKYFHSNGKLWCERIYRNGNLWEVISNFSSGSTPLDPGTIKNGRGTVKVYDENGVIQETLLYENGKCMN